MDSIGLICAADDAQLTSTMDAATFRDEVARSSDPYLRRVEQARTAAVDD